RRVGRQCLTILDPGHDLCRDQEELCVAALVLQHGESAREVDLGAGRGALPGLLMRHALADDDLLQRIGIATGRQGGERKPRRQPQHPHGSDRSFRLGQKASAPAAITCLPSMPDQWLSLPNSDRHDHRRRVSGCRPYSLVKPIAPWTWCAVEVPMPIAILARSLAAATSKS